MDLLNSIITSTRGEKTEAAAAGAAAAMPASRPANAGTPDAATLHKRMLLVKESIAALTDDLAAADDLAAPEIERKLVAKRATLSRIARHIEDAPPPPRTDKYVNLVATLAAPGACHIEFGGPLARTDQLVNTDAARGGKAVAVDECARECFARIAVACTNRALEMTEEPFAGAEAVFASEQARFMEKRTAAAALAAALDEAAVVDRSAETMFSCAMTHARAASARVGAAAVSMKLSRAMSRILRHASDGSRSFAAGSTIAAGRFVEELDAEVSRPFVSEWLARVALPVGACESKGVAYAVDILRRSTLIMGSGRNVPREAAASAIVALRSIPSGVSNEQMMSRAELHILQHGGDVDTTRAWAWAWAAAHIDEDDAQSCTVSEVPADVIAQNALQAYTTAREDNRINALVEMYENGGAGAVTPEGAEMRCDAAREVAARLAVLRRTFDAVGCGEHLLAYIQNSASAASSTSVKSCASKYGVMAAGHVLSEDAARCPKSVVFACDGLAAAQTTLELIAREGASEMGGVRLAFSDSTTSTFAVQMAKSGLSQLRAGTLAASGATANACEIANDIARTFTETREYLISDEPVDLFPQLIPFVSPTRLEPDQPYWLDIGRAVYSTFVRCMPTLNKYSSASYARAIWIEVSAQAAWVQHVRKNLYARLTAQSPSNAEAVAAVRPLSDAHTDGMPHRTFCNWLFKTSGAGVGAVRWLAVRERGEETASAAVPGLEIGDTEAASRNDVMSRMCSSSGSNDFFGALNVLSDMLDDPFVSRTATQFAARFICGWKVCGAASFAVEDAVMISRAFINFRTAYRSIYEVVHRRTVAAYTTDESTVASAVAREVESIYHEGTLLLRQTVGDALRVPAPTVSRRAAAAAGRLAGDITDGTAVTADAIDTVTILSDSAAESAAQRAIRTNAMPSDFSWGMIQENNCVSMFTAMFSTVYEDVKRGDARWRGALRERVAGFTEIAGSTRPSDLAATITLVTESDNQAEINAFVAESLRAFARSSGISTQCSSEWQKSVTAVDLGVTVRTVGTFARDSPDHFSAWRTQWATAVLHEAARCAPSGDTSLIDRDTVLGEFSARLLWQDYFAVPSVATRARAAPVVWFRFHGHSLRMLEGSDEIERDWRIVAKKCFSDANDYVSAQFKVASARAAVFKAKVGQGGVVPPAIVQTMEKMAEIKTLYSSLLKHMNRGEEHIIRAMRKSSVLMTPRATRLMNENHFLLAYTNGVLDITRASRGGKKPIFRDGKPEDYISLSTGIAMPYGGDVPVPREIASIDPNEIDEWQRPFSDEHPDVIMFDNYMKQVFVDPELRRYFLIDVSSFIEGGNTAKKMREYCGDGNNSKTILTKIMQAAYGELSVDIPPEFFTVNANRQSSAPAPELAQCASARIVFSSEPGIGLVMDCGMIKRVTGGDRFFVRGLHENGGCKTLSFKLVISMNDVSEKEGFDEASKRRVEIIPFQSEWCFNAPATEAEQFAQKRFPIDTKFEVHIPRLARAYAWRMFHLYPEYVATQDTMAQPEVVKRYISEYWQRVDPYEGFKADCIERGTVDDFITGKTLYNEFRAWFISRNPDARGAPSYVKFLKEMKRKSRLGEFSETLKASDGKWYGYRIASAEESEEDED
jgi:hypothetical protein